MRSLLVYIMWTRAVLQFINSIRLDQTKLHTKKTLFRKESYPSL